jgi:hypothetical protein
MQTVTTPIMVDEAVGVDVISWLEVGVVLEEGAVIGEEEDDLIQMGGELEEPFIAVVVVVE